MRVEDGVDLAAVVVVAEQLEPRRRAFARDDRRQRQHDLVLRRTDRSSVAWTMPSPGTVLGALMKPSSRAGFRSEPSGAP